MQRSGFGGRHGTKSARSAGKIRPADKSSNFLNLVRSIAGDDLLFCVDALSINDIASGSAVTTWGDAWGVWATNFEEAEVDDAPKLGVYNGKRVTAWVGEQFMRGAAAEAQLNGIKDLSIVFFSKHNTDAWGNILELSPTYNSNAGTFVMGDDPSNANYQSYYALGNSPYNVSATKPAYMDCSQPYAGGAVFNANGVGVGVDNGSKTYIDGAHVPAADLYSTTALNITDAFNQTKKLHLGSRGNSSLFWNGSIGCAIAIMRGLTDGEMSRLQMAVLDRWNVNGSVAIL